MTVCLTTLRLNKHLTNTLRSNHNALIKTVAPTQKSYAILPASSSFSSLHYVPGYQWQTIGPRLRLTQAPASHKTERFRACLNALWHHCSKPTASLHMPFFCSCFYWFFKLSQNKHSRWVHQFKLERTKKSHKPLYSNYSCHLKLGFSSEHEHLIHKEELMRYLKMESTHQ